MKLSALDEALFELPNLIAGIRHGSEGPKHSFSYWGTVEGISRGEDMLLDRRGQAQHAHDLVYAGSRDPLPSGNVGLVGDLAGLQEGLPFDGLAEELDHPGCFGLLWRLWVAPAAMEGVYDLVGGHPARQGADVAVFEGPLGSKGDLDRLFAVGGHGGAVVAFLGDVDDPEPDLGLRGAPAAVSRAAHLGTHIGLEPVLGF